MSVSPPVPDLERLRELEHRYDQQARATIARETIADARTATARMRVRVRALREEAPPEAGPSRPVIVTVDIDATCPACGGPRGEPRLHTVHDILADGSGVFYAVSGWINPCGHTDRISDVLGEASARRIARVTA